MPTLTYEQSGHSSPGLLYYVSTTLKTKTTLNGAKGLAVDGNEVVYIANTGVSQALDESWRYVPAYVFPETVIDQTSTAIVQSILNIGNAAIDFVVPVTGQNPSVSSPFVVNTGEADACPVLTTSSDPASLTPGDACSVSVSLSPTATGTFTGSLNYQASGSTLSRFGFSLSGQGIAPIPVITWPAPASIAYGTALELHAARRHRHIQRPDRARHIHLYAGHRHCAQRWNTNAQDAVRAVCRQLLGNERECDHRCDPGSTHRSRGQLQPAL